jgi:hypothetical protein
MKKKLIIIISICAIHYSYSQDIYFNLGRNFTTYDYQNSSGKENENIENGTGDYYEFGYSNSFNSTNFSYEVGLIFNEYNAIGGDSANTYSWDTNYFGIQSLVSFNFITTNSFEVLVTTGLNLNTLISGEQEINGEYFNLIKEEEFSSLIIQPKVGLQVKYLLDRFGCVAIGYNFSKSFNPFNSSNEKLSFINNQIQFGIHFYI